MKKEYENKAIEAGDEKIKTLVCVRESVMPGVGYFKVDEEISGKDLVEKLKDHPNFIVKQEEK